MVVAAVFTDDLPGSTFCILSKRSAVGFTMQKATPLAVAGFVVRNGRPLDTCYEQVLENPRRIEL